LKDSKKGELGIFVVKMDAKKKKELSVNKSFDICFHSQFFPTPDLTEECTRGSMRRSRYFLEKKKKDP